MNLPEVTNVTRHGDDHNVVHKARVASIRATSKSERRRPTSVRKHAFLEIVEAIIAIDQVVVRDTGCEIEKAAAIILDQDALGIFIATLRGAAVGVEREWSGHAAGPNARLAGIRTFTLLGLLAGLSSWLWSVGVHTVAAIVLGFVVLLAGVIEGLQPPLETCYRSCRSWKSHSSVICGTAAPASMMSQSERTLTN